MLHTESHFFYQTYDFLGRYGRTLEDTPTEHEFEPYLWETLLSLKPHLFLAILCSSICYHFLKVCAKLQMDPFLVVWTTIFETNEKMKELISSHVLAS